MLNGDGDGGLICPLFVKSPESSYVSRDADHQPLTGAVRLPTHTGTLGCWVFPLAQSIPP